MRYVDRVSSLEINNTKLVKKSEIYLIGDDKVLLRLTISPWRPFLAEGHYCRLEQEVKQIATPQHSPI